jgi:hypothetical protein
LSAISRAAVTLAALILNLVAKVWHFVAVSRGAFLRGSYSANALWVRARG